MWSKMVGDTVRVTCATENCGTFPMDRALYDKLRRTGEPFTCPAGHEQNFTESPEQQLRERVETLKRKLERAKKSRDRARENARDLYDDIREERERRKYAESRLLDYAEGVVEVAPGRYKWACKCGGRGQKAFEDVDRARGALESHRSRDACPADGPVEIATVDE